MPTVALLSNTPAVYGVNTYAAINDAQALEPNDTPVVATVVRKTHVLKSFLLLSTMYALGATLAFSLRNNPRILGTPGCLASASFFDPCTKLSCEDISIPAKVTNFVSQIDSTLSDLDAACKVPCSFKQDLKSSFETVS